MTGFIEPMNEPTVTQWKKAFFKSGLAQKLMIQPNDPGAFHLHSNEDGSLDGYGKEMCAEIWDDKTLAWINLMERPNHYWDCEVMCLALADIKGVKNIPLPGVDLRKKHSPEGSSCGDAAEDGKVRGTSRHGSRE